MQKLGTLIGQLIGFINGVIVPFVFAIAFLLFLVGVFRYFIMGATNPEIRKQGASFVVYALIGFVLMMSLWGIVNLAKNTLGLDSNTRPCLPTFKSGCINGANKEGSTNTTSKEPTNLLPSGYGATKEPEQSDPAGETNLNGIY